MTKALIFSTAAMLILQACAQDELPAGRECAMDQVRSGQECAEPNRDQTRWLNAQSNPDIGRGYTDMMPPVMNGPESLPMPVDDWFFPSGFMGDGEMSGTPSRPAQRRQTPPRAHVTDSWYRAKRLGRRLLAVSRLNWGNQPGLAIPRGAQSVRFRAWAPLGVVASFSAGMGDVDGFSAESAPSHSPPHLRHMPST